MSTANKEMPRGSEFFEAVAQVESLCAAESLKDIPRLGISTPACYESLGDVLPMLYAEASCFYGCPGGDHFLQRLIARIVTHSMSSLRLALLGYYDESLALTRNLGEIANLLFLFAAKPEFLEAWRQSDKQKRHKEFTPLKVRLKLEEMGLRPLVDSSRYGLLSEVGVHLVPEVLPQAFNESDRSTLGARFQFEGLMCTLNELAFVVAEAAGCVSVLLNADERRDTLRIEATVLLNFVGNLDLKVAREGFNARPL